MSKLFLFSLTEIFSQISLDLIVILANSVIIAISATCLVITLVKRGYSVINRLWAVILTVGVWCIQAWFELTILGYVKHLFLTVGISIFILSPIFFLPIKTIKITTQQRDLARLISDKIKNQREQKDIDLSPEKSVIFSSPIIKAEQKKTSDENKSEIDFSHVKSVLNKLEYYPLKEQDKKQAKELENAIILAEQNGINLSLKEKINDGLGALLKIMSKYAI